MRCKIFFGCLFAVLMAAPVRAQTQAVELSTLFGTYSTSKFTLTIDRTGHYRQTWGDCTTESYEQGTYVVKDNVISLVVAKRGVRDRDAKHWKNLLDPKIWKRFESSDEPWPMQWQLFPITWGERLYLMEKDDFVDFANAINFGIEPRAGVVCDWPWGGFYLREGDNNKRVSGRPLLPEDVVSLLLDNPVEAEIAGIERDGEARVAILNKGTIAGLRPGMRLILQGGQPKYSSEMKIIAANENSARLRLDEEAKVGDKVFSNFERVRLTIRLNQQ